MRAMLSGEADMFCQVIRHIGNPDYDFWLSISDIVKYCNETFDYMIGIWKTLVKSNLFDGRLLDTLMISTNFSGEWRIPKDHKVVAQALHDNYLPRTLDHAPLQNNINDFRTWLPQAPSTYPAFKQCCNPSIRQTFDWLEFVSQLPIPARRTICEFL